RIATPRGLPLMNGASGLSLAPSKFPSPIMMSQCVNGECDSLRMSGVAQYLSNAKLTGPNNPCCFFTASGVNFRQCGAQDENCRISRWSDSDTRAAHLDHALRCVDVAHRNASDRCRTGHEAGADRAADHADRRADAWRPGERADDF